MCWTVLRNEREIPIGYQCEYIPTYLLIGSQKIQIINFVVTMVLNLFLKVKEPAKEQPPRFFHETTRVLWDIWSNWNFSLFDTRCTTLVRRLVRH